MTGGRGVPVRKGTGLAGGTYRDAAIEVQGSLLSLLMKAWLTRGWRGMWEVRLGEWRTGGTYSAGWPVQSGGCLRVPRGDVWADMGSDGMDGSEAAAAATVCRGYSLMGHLSIHTGG